MMDLYNLRRQYQSGDLRRADLAVDPIIQFEHWLKELMTHDTPDPTAMVLATVDRQGQPSQRIVLLKKFDAEGFVFFTNRESNKAEDMQHNTQVSLHFPWYFINRQVLVRGDVQHTTKAEDEAYFANRPKQSQLAAWASAQSQPLDSRDQLMLRFADKQAEFPNEVPLPGFWGGYRVVPTVIEFWQGRENRLHDRFVYTKERTHWNIQRLSP